MKKERKLTVVIGCSRFGANIADINSDMGINTIIVDKDEDAFLKLDSSYSGFKVTGNGEEMDVLRSAKITQASEIVCCTDDDNATILIASICLKYTKCPHIIVRLHDEEKRVLLSDPRVVIIAPSQLSMGMYQNLWDVN